jgi:hypothetical protein
MRYASTLILLLAAAAAGCGTETDDRPATFSYIHQAIIVPSCATAVCHSTQNHISGVDMEDRESAYDAFAIVDIKELSPIYGQIGGEIEDPSTIPDAGRMPLDSPLPEADILLIGRWIDDGAENN